MSQPGCPDDPIALKLRRCGIARSTDGLIRFLHATHSKYDFSTNTIIQAIGFGEYGRGFYAYLNNELGRARGLEWSARQGQGKHSPILVHLVIADWEFADFEHLEIPVADITQRVKQLCADGVTGKPVVFGPMTIRDQATGGRLPKWPHPHLPLQFKFEDQAAKLLRVVGVEKL